MSHDNSGGELAAMIAADIAAGIDRDGPAALPPLAVALLMSSGPGTLPRPEFQAAVGAAFVAAGSVPVPDAPSRVGMTILAVIEAAAIAAAIVHAEKFPDCPCPRSDPAFILRDIADEIESRGVAGKIAERVADAADDDDDDDDGPAEFRPLTLTSGPLGDVLAPEGGLIDAIDAAELSAMLDAEFVDGGGDDA